ncbi:MAG TPA: FUSC family protein [Terriglobales bacterium]|nr:FUSC family protein [Terriglobales bacterium]
MATWIERLGVTRASAMNAARTAVATLASLMLARLLKLNEFYWAPISTIVILLSTIDPLSGSWQRFVGTALGAALGALIATFFRVGWAIYGAGIFICGILCAILRIKESYRIAAITLSIVLLITHGSAPWMVALHRFIEVSIGIAVALLVTTVWKVPQL